MAQPAKLFLKQPQMIRVLYALIPISLGAVYLFGVRVLLLLAVVSFAGFLAEYLFARSAKQPVSSAVFVTTVLFGLSLPPAIPFWMAAVGVVFGVVFGKMVFGGFGRNIFNPALVGRAFLYVCFPAPMTTQWTGPVSAAATGIWRGFGRYLGDAMTGPTPLVVMKTGNPGPSWTDLLLGNTAGSVGETGGLLVVLCGVYIVWKKAADYRIVVSGCAVFAFIQTVLWRIGPAYAVDPVTALFSGSFLFGIFFFATEPVSAPKHPVAKWLYGGFIAAMSVVIRTWSTWPEGMMFAVLLGNMFAPITDYAIGARSRR